MPDSRFYINKKIEFNTQSSSEDSSSLLFKKKQQQQDLRPCPEKSIGAIILLVRKHLYVDTRHDPVFDP